MRPRLIIEETGQVAAALDIAAAHWPHVTSRRDLLLRLVEQGRAVIERDHAEETERRLAAVDNANGTLTDSYESGYLKRLRDDWPA